MSANDDKEKYEFLEMALARKDIMILADHGVSEAYNSIRINICNVISRNWVAKLLPRWAVIGITLYTFGLFKTNVVYLTYGNNKSSYILMILQKIFSKIIKPRPHIMFDCLWEGENGILRKILVKIRANLVNSVASKCIVYGKKDVDKFNKILGISRDKLLFMRYHHTLKNSKYAEEVEVREGDYIFSGGTPGREFSPLLNICTELKIPLKIATFDPDIIEKGRGNPLFEIRSTSPEGFLHLMANSRMVVVPYGKSILRTGGHQTMLNAMKMGKPLIVYNEDIAEGYVISGVNGIIIIYGNTNGLKNELERLFYDKEYRDRLRILTKEWVKKNDLSQDRWAKNVYNLAAEMAYKKTGNL